MPVSTDLQFLPGEYTDLGAHFPVGSSCTAENGEWENRSQQLVLPTDLHPASTAMWTAPSIYWREWEGRREKES